jgi:hypothetical protein
MQHYSIDKSQHITSNAQYTNILRGNPIGRE